MQWQPQAWQKAAAQRPGNQKRSKKNHGNVVNWQARTRCGNAGNQTVTAAVTGKQAERRVRVRCSSSVVTASSNAAAAVRVNNPQRVVHPEGKGQRQERVQARTHVPDRRWLGMRGVKLLQTVPRPAVAQCGNARCGSGGTFAIVVGLR